MSLYFIAKSKNKIGYTVDWLKVTYTENKKTYELTLDLQGWIDYSENKLDCRCKCDLIPWTLYDCETGNEEDLYGISPRESIARFPNKKIAEIICAGTNHKIGIYPMCPYDVEEEKYFALAQEDELYEHYGFFGITEDDVVYEKEFIFETELNY